jgi:glutaminase
MAAAAAVPLIPGVQEPFVSTGHLPPPIAVDGLVEEAHARFHTIGDGALSDVYPALARTPPELFGICVAATDGLVSGAGDFELEFSLMSIAKPFVFALVCAVLGPEETRLHVGVNATGLPFNSLSAVTESADGRTNPMVNPGAIATTSLVPGTTSTEKWEFIRLGLSRFAARNLSLDDEIYASASATNHRNRELARLLAERGRLYAQPDESLDLYTRQSSLRVTARDLAVMGATLADGGVNPVTGVRVVDPETCRYTLAVMASAGSTRRPATGSTTSVYPGRAASAAVSSPSRPARAASERSRRCSTKPATASRESWWRSSSLSASGSISSRRRRARRTSARGSRRKEHERGRDPTAHGDLVGECQLEEDRVDVPFDGSFRQEQPLGGRGVAEPFGHEREYLPFA